MYDAVLAMIEKIFGGGSSASTAADMFLNTASGSQFSNLWVNTVMPIYENYLVPFGLCILVIMFFYALVDKMATTEITFEVIGGMICKLCLLAAFMEAALTLAYSIIQATDLTVKLMSQESFANAGAASSAQSAALTALFGTTDPRADKWTGMFAGILEAFDCIGAILALFLPWLVMYVCEALIKVITLTREIEICARAAFMPVALGDSYNGLTSGGARFLKSFLAVCLQGVLIVVVLLVADGLSTEYLKDITSGGSVSGFNGVMGLVIMPIVYRIAATGLILKSMPLAKEVCGVG